MAPTSQRTPSINMGVLIRSSKLGTRYLLDVALVAALIISVGQLVQELRRSPNRRPDVRSQLVIGETVQAANLHWPEAEATVVLFVSATCGVCKDSVGFYKRLAEAVEVNGRLRLTIATPEALERVRHWLLASGISPTKMVQISEPGKMGVPLTPAILLLDSSGRVTDVAHGGLSTDEEDVIIARMQDATDHTPFDIRSNVSLISPATLTRLQESGSVVLVDARTRLDGMSPTTGGTARRDAQIVVDCRKESFGTCMLVSNALLPRSADGVFAVLDR